MKFLSQSNSQNMSQSEKFLVLYGSFVQKNNKRPPRDIDIMFGGSWSLSSIKSIVYEKFPNARHLPIDFVETKFPNKAKIFVPCDSPSTNYEILFGNPTVFIEREYNEFTSIFREGAGIGKALERLLSTNCISLNIRENGNYDESQHDTYSKGRKALQDSVDYHFGREAFNTLCEKLWYGKLLRKLSEDPPSNQSSVEAVAAQSNWNPPNHARLNFMNLNQRIITDYDSKKWTEPYMDPETWIRRLYSDGIFYTN